MISQALEETLDIRLNDQLNVAYTGTEKTTAVVKNLPALFKTKRHSTFSELFDYLNDQPISKLPEIILIETDNDGECFKFVERVKKNPLWRELIIVMIATQRNKEWKSLALKLKVHDYYILPFPAEHLLERLNFLIKFKLIKPQLSALQEVDVVYQLPPGKKLFDVLVSATALLLLLPIMALTAIIIRLDSKGPVIYKSKRVGTGYKIFNFYKFRSMYMDADKRLEELSNFNAYANKENMGAKSAFVKLRDDPRITQFGRFIRQSSIDELPQLFNVLMGDMSLVGNRPLPLYEAEMLTSNEWSMRFMGPAGVTGLWQIKSRGAKGISERERKKFDNFYATKYSFWFDVKILLMTVPVIFHKEKF